MAGDEEMRSRSASRSPSRGRNRSATRSRSRSRSPITRTVFIKNLTRNIVHGHLRAVFSPYGDIRKIHMPTHPRSGQTKGSAHIEFYDSQAAKTAVTHMHTGLLDGATLAVELSDPPRSPSPPRRQHSPRPAPRRFAIGDPLPVVAHHPGNLWETLTDHQSRVVGVEALILGVTGLSPHRVVAVLTRAVLLAHLLTLAQAILRVQDRVHGHVQGH
ncbi:unnamed protein product [Rhizoctonia solani]|uniref:RRM domain-containing protein n=1 Tax=Rhizoctonia solani TaxID=456999 RepID=A0A8H3DHT8_9AGAM|nr:unnamed protein product [Rhizoctonia solani]